MKGRLATSRRLGVPGEGLPARDENLLLRVGVVICSVAVELVTGGRERERCEEEWSGREIKKDKRYSRNGQVPRKYFWSHRWVSVSGPLRCSAADVVLEDHQRSSVFCAEERGPMGKDRSTPPLRAHLRPNPSLSFPQPRPESICVRSNKTKRRHGRVAAMARCRGTR